MPAHRQTSRAVTQPRLKALSGLAKDRQKTPALEIFSSCAQNRTHTHFRLAAVGNAHHIPLHRRPLCL